MQNGLALYTLNILAAVQPLQQPIINNILPCVTSHHCKHKLMSMITWYTLQHAVVNIITLHARGFFQWTSTIPGKHTQHKGSILQIVK